VSEITYPIYQFRARWTEKRVKVEEYDDTHGLPVGRKWNGTDFSRMFKEDQDWKQLDVILIEFWQKYERKGEEVELFSLHAELERRETWCLTWFSHYTFDVGQTDEEAMESFRNYVRRMVRLPGFENFGQEGVRGFTLMSAKDEWRWKSGSDEYEGLPCRCKSCKEQGVLRIAH
jgi:hypothetical protein